MAFAIIHMEKIQARNFSGKFKHNSRDMKQTEKNQNVDFSESHRNLSYGIVSLGDFTKYKRKHINPYVVRKDNVIVNELILSVSADYFKEKNPEQINQWWQDNLDFLKSRYGENFIGASLHLDEKTPHIHANIVPLEKVIDKDTNESTFKLNGKKLFNREALKSLQDDYPAFMKSRGHDLSRGEEEKAVKHTDQKAYSVATNGLLDLAKKDKKYYMENVEKIIRKNVTKIVSGKELKWNTDKEQYKEEVSKESVKATIEELEPFLARNLLKSYIGAARKIDAEAVQKENEQLKFDNQKLAIENEKMLQANILLGEEGKRTFVAQNEKLTKENSELKLKLDNVQNELKIYKSKLKSKGIEWE